MSNHQVTIGVVIPSYNEGQDLIETLNTLLNQTIPFKEIIVVDDSSDETNILVEQTFGEQVILIHREGKLGRCSARNVGIHNCSSDVVVILNADVSLPSNFCEQLMAKYTSTDCDALGLGLVITNTRHPYARYLYALHLSTDKKKILWTEGFSVRRSCFFKTKGFPDNYPMSIVAGEDGEFCFDLQRNGAKICLDFNIKVFTVMPEDPKVIEEQMKGRASLRTWHFVYDKSIVWMMGRSILKQVYRLISVMILLPLLNKVFFLWRHYNQGLIDLCYYAKYEIYIYWLQTCQEWEDIFRFTNLYRSKGIKISKFLFCPPSQLSLDDSN
jgi:glycosyltransferase involved in cell wall biosynthesis